MSVAARPRDALQRSRSGHPGTYALVFYVAGQFHLQVGKLGRFSFPQGYYLYVGSALGGLKGRLGRHLNGPRRLHWHVDYLAAESELLELWWKPGSERAECSWASAALASSGASLPVPGFGSSDCRCAGHLVRFPSLPTASVLGSDDVSVLKISDLVLVP